MPGQKKTALRHLKELHGAISEISHLANKSAEISKDEGLKNANELLRKIEKAQKIMASDLEKLMHNLD
ncbi:MAG TPA: hypothetical protein VI815_00425 [Candidatus Nanoarchaeia archaeon]|nr:hypothetical protein [Candidatus Nanoarchaeia archaeon]